MMDCHRISALLSSYLDVELSPAQAAEVTSHLRDCAACREQLESLRVAMRLVASLPAPRLAVDLVPVVVAQASASPWSGKWEAAREFAAFASGFMAHEFARAAALAALFVIVWMGREYQAAALVISWPARVAAVAEMGTSSVTASLDRMSTLLTHLAKAPTRPKPATRPEPQRRSGPARSISSTTAVVRGPEVSRHVIV